MTASQARVSGIIDALDESTTREKLLKWIKCVASAKELGHFKLLLIGQPEYEFISNFPLLIGEENCIPLEKSKKVSADIYSYSEGRLQQLEFTRNNLPAELNKKNSRQNGGRCWRHVSVCST